MQDDTQKIRLIVGLGNPGSEYTETRHNVGAWFVDALAERYQATLRLDTKFHGTVAKFSDADSTAWLLKPSTYMNESGLSVLSFAHFYKILPDSILVVHDELDFDAGIVRIKEGGGHGGHNGLRDIIRHLKTGDFFRLRLGIGHPGDKSRVTPYVLGAPSRSDHDQIVQSIDEALSAVPDLMAGDLQKAFRLLHS